MNLKCFISPKNQGSSPRRFLSLFKTSAQFYKYLLTILVGVPVWFTISQLAIHAGEYAALGISAEPISSGKAVTFHYIGASVGSLLFGYLSQSLQSRKRLCILH